MDQQTLAERQFGAMAGNYLTSAVHAVGADLTRLEALAAASPPRVALDIGCGAGHASYALARGGTQRVIAYDLSPAMLAVVSQQAAALRHGQIETQSGPAERLPLPTASADLVVTRYSAHHWLDVPAALAEIARVLRPGGTLVVIDVLAPANPLYDTVLQTLEFLRDPSHVRDYRESEWTLMLQDAGFTPGAMDRWKLVMQFDAWVARIGTPPARVRALEAVIDALPSEARHYLELTHDRSFSIDAGWSAATRV